MTVKKERMVGTRLPASFIADLEEIEKAEQSDRSTVLRRLLYRAIRDWKLEYYAHEYGQGRLTMGGAAERAGVSIWVMLEYVRESGIPAQYSLRDLQHDIDVIGN